MAPIFAGGGGSKPGVGSNVTKTVKVGGKDGGTVKDIASKVVDGLDWGWGIESAAGGKKEGGGGVRGKPISNKFPGGKWTANGWVSNGSGEEKKGVVKKARGGSFIVEGKRREVEAKGDGKGGRSGGDRGSKVKEGWEEGVVAGGAGGIGRTIEATLGVLEGAATVASPLDQGGQHSMGVEKEEEGVMGGRAEGGGSPETPVKGTRNEGGTPYKSEENRGKDTPVKGMRKEGGMPLKFGQDVIAHTPMKGTRKEVGGEEEDRGQGGKVKGRGRGASAKDASVRAAVDVIPDVRALFSCMHSFIHSFIGWLIAFQKHATQPCRLRRTQLGLAPRCQARSL